MRRYSFVIIGCFLVLLPACSLQETMNDAGDESEEQVYPYVLQMPDATVIDTQYKDVKHNLSPLAQYHFQILIPKDWQVLDTHLEADPPVGDFDEMGVFRQEGEWMRNEEIPPAGEISVSLIHPQDADQTAVDWLDEILPEHIASYELLEERTMGSGSAEAADYLFYYTDRGAKYVMRVSAFRANDRIIFFSCSDTANGYRDNAEACYTALASFQLLSAPTVNPFRQQ